MPADFPSDWQEQPCFVVAIPRPLVPFVGGLMKIMENRGFWVDDSTYVNAYSAVLEFERCLVATCLQDLIDAQDRTYRMLDTTLRGTAYSGTGTEGDPVIPAIPPFVDLGFVDQNSIFGQLDRTTQLIDASINGTDTPLYTISPSVRALLQSILDASGSDDSDLESILAQLELIASLVA